VTGSLREIPVIHMICRNKRGSPNYREESLMERTYLRCYLYACPEGEREAAAEAMDYENMSEPNLANEAEAWVNDDALAGSADHLADALRDAAPGASWVLWEDPVTDIGTLCARTPELGDFSASCTGGGDVVLTHDQVADVIDAAANEWRTQESALAMAAAIQVAVDRAMGVPWMKDWAGHR
jgi:hypothetical protein